MFPQYLQKTDEREEFCVLRLPQEALRALRTSNWMADVFIVQGVLQYSILEIKDLLKKFLSIFLTIFLFSFVLFSFSASIAH